MGNGISVRGEGAGRISNEEEDFESPELMRQSPPLSPGGPVLSPLLFSPQVCTLFLARYLLYFFSSFFLLFDYFQTCAFDLRRLYKKKISKLILLCYQAPLVPLQRNEEVNAFGQNPMNWSTEQDDMILGQLVPTIISWSSGGHHVAVEGSWDDWRTR